MKKSTKKWIAGGLAGVFAAAAIGTATIPALNGTQSDAVWEAQAKGAVEQYLQDRLPYINVKKVVEEDHLINITTVPGSTKPDNAKGVFDGKFIDLNVSGFSGFLTSTFTVKCDQKRVDLVRGGDINCTVTSITPPRLG